MKFINWFKGVWLSFKVARNTQRLLSLLQCLDDHVFDRDHMVTIATYRNVVRWFLCEYPHLDSSVWPLDEARDLHIRSSILVEIGDILLYGTD